MTKSHLSVVSSLALGVLAVASVGLAEPPRTYGNGAKIHRGIKSRSITKRERKIIAKSRHRLIRVRQHALRDGYVTRREARRIKTAQRTLHRRVYWAKHNNQVRKHQGSRRSYGQHGHAWHGTDRYLSWW